MKKKELLQLIIELQAKVAILETKIANLQPNIITTPVGLLPFIVTCQHEYPSLWGGTTPPCLKCGQAAPGYPSFICSSGGVGAADQAHTEYVVKTFSV